MNKANDTLAVPARFTIDVVQAEALVTGSS